MRVQGFEKLRCKVWNPWGLHTTILELSVLQTVNHPWTVKFPLLPYSRTALHPLSVRCVKECRVAKVWSHSLHWTTNIDGIELSTTKLTQLISTNKCEIQMPWPGWTSDACQTQKLRNLYYAVTENAYILQSTQTSSKHVLMCMCIWLCITHMCWICVCLCVCACAVCISCACTSSCICLHVVCVIAVWVWRCTGWECMCVRE